MTVRVRLSWDAVCWGLYVSRGGSWAWLDGNQVQLEIPYAEANRVLGLTGMTAPGAAELVNALELGVFEAESQARTLEAPQN